MENQEKFNNEIIDLKQKYETIIKRLDVIEKESTETENSIKKIENNFSLMNNNFKELMGKIDTIIEDKEVNKMFNNVKRGSFSLMGMISRPMRRLAVGTMRSMFSVADFASEKVSYAREGVEDMVAEAQYESKKRRSNMMPNEQC